MENRLTVHLTVFGTILAMAVLVMILPAAAASQGPTVDTSFEKDLWAIKYHDQWRTPVTLHVNNANPQASDENPGTTARPLKTIQRAIDLSTPGTRILIEPGMYRESLRIPTEKSGTEKAPLVIEAAKKDSVIVSGSDVWQGWAATETPGVYWRDWPYKFGLSGHHFPGVAENKPIGRHQEMVFVDGKLYRQVMERKEMAAETYWVNEEEKRLLVCFPEKLRPEEHLIEVTVRATGLDTGWINSLPSYYVVRGLVFQHFWGGSNAYGSHFLVEDCRFDWNNGGGLGSGGKGYVLRRNIANHNGYSGMGIPPIPDFTSGALLEDNETSYNNWRGLMGGYTGFSIAGFKSHYSANIIVRNHRCIGNSSPGVWFDNNNRNISFEDGVFSENQNGIWIEISPGPVRISKCTITRNGTGIVLSNGAHVTIEDCLLYDNSGSQIGSWEPEVDRGQYWSVGLTLRNNVIVSAKPEQLLLHLPAHEPLFDTFSSGKNLWYQPEGNGFWIGKNGLDFANWIIRTHQDTDSVMAEPRFRDPKNNDFTLLPDSPLKQRAHWGERACVVITPQHYLFDASTGKQFFMATRPAELEVRYTLDGSEPTAASPRYTGVIKLEKTANIVAKVFSKGWKDCPSSRAFLFKTELPAPSVYLSDLKMLSGTVGWGDTPRLDKSILDKLIGICSISFNKGIGIQADSELVYELKPEYKRFVSFIGIDDQVDDKETPNVIYQVFADEKLLFESAVLRANQPPVEVDVAIPEGSKKLRLVVKGGGEETDWNSADWARAGFLTK